MPECVDSAGCLEEKLLSLRAHVDRNLLDLQTCLNTAIDGVEIYTRPQLYRAMPRTTRSRAAAQTTKPGTSVCRCLVAPLAGSVSMLDEC